MASHDKNVLFCVILLSCTSTTIGIGPERDDALQSKNAQSRHFNLQLKVNDEAYEWSPWTVSTCSRSCGTGIQLKQRYCQHKRYGFKGSYEQKYCAGDHKVHALCNTQVCSEAGTDTYREEQCSQYDNLEYSGIKYKWVPQEDNSVAEQTARDKCALVCKGRNGILSLTIQFAESFKDGTPCHYNKNENGICIRGSCIKISCDGMLNSTSWKDVCGMCNGDNSTCEYITGRISKALDIGYNAVLQLPLGTSLLSIADTGINSAVFAVRSSSTIYFAGTRHSNENPTIYTDIAGTSFEYYQHQAGAQHRKELFCKGPINTELTIMMLSPKSGMSGFLKYSYVLYKSQNYTRLSYHDNSTLTKKPQRVSSSGQPFRKYVRNKNRKYRRKHYRVNVVSDPGPGVVFSRGPQISPQSTSSDNSEYFWRISALAPCSATCTVGVSSTYAQCYRRIDNQVVDDRHCADAAKPNHVKLQCMGKPCHARWVVGSWSTCSVSCGKGTQQRSVRCWRVLAPGFDSTVHDHMCVGIKKPVTRKPCVQVECGPQWLASPWNECSARCGKGMQTRHGICLSPMQNDTCDRRKRPLVARQCDMGPCNNIWVVSHWTNCSGDCSNGTSHRSVSCRDPVGNFLNDRHCDQQLRPLSTRLCAEVSDFCPSSWTPQDWTACSVTCGEGVTSRAVVCEVVEKGNYLVLPDSECEHLYKPPSRGQCQERPCQPMWYTSQWSECSQTCGKMGVRLRQVYCYRDKEPSILCDKGTKPHHREICQLAPCGHEKQVNGTKCKDLLRIGCDLVLKTQLCSHWYYKRACCQTCHQSTLPSD